MSSYSDQSSSEFSEADAKKVLSSLKGMDDLDADLFKPKKTTFQTQSKTQPKQEGPKFPGKAGGFKSQDFFDEEDPLAGILSDDDDDDNIPQKKPAASISPAKKFNTSTGLDGSRGVDSSPKKPAPSVKPAKSTELDTKKNIVIKDDEKLFADDDDDILNTLGLDETSAKSKPADKPSSNYQSPLDKLLASKSPADTPQKQTGPARKFRFDKDGNLISDKSAPKPAEPEGSSFGSYVPSTTSAVQKPARSVRSSLPKPDDNFLDFLGNDDSASKSKKVESSYLPSTVAHSRRARAASFLELGEEVDITSDSSIDEKVTTPAKKANKDPDEDFLSFLRNDPAPKKDDLGKPPLGRGAGRRAQAGKPDKDVDLESVATEDDQRSVSAGQEKTQARVPPLDIPRSPALQPSTPLLQSASLPSSTQQASPIAPPRSAPANVGKSALNLDGSSTWASPAEGSIRPARSSDLRPAPHGARADVPPTTQFNFNQDLFEDLQKTFQADLNVTKQAYQDRIEALHVEVAEIKTRADREVDAIKESYNLRMEIMRKQMKERFEDVYDKDVGEQDEIKRLRSLHMQALEETRLDYEDRINIMKDSHNRELDVMKTSTGHVRNVDAMMKKVDDATAQLDSLTSQYESVYRSMNQKWADMATDNKRFTSSFESRFDDLQQRNMDLQSNLMQVVSRLEGHMTEMNRALRDTQYQMQLEQKRLEATQTSVENEKRQVLQQVAAERTDVLNAHKEAIELRQRYERSAREDSDRLRQWQEYLLQSQRVLEEARAAEVKQTQSREGEWRKIENHLAKERAVVFEKTEKLSAIEAKMEVHKQDIERREVALALSEKRIHDRTEEVRRREEELRISKEVASRKMDESANMLQEAKRVEQVHESRLNEIHDNANALAKQRQLLAEERKKLMEDRVNYPRDDALDNRFSSPHSTPHRPITRMNASTPVKSTTANKALWTFTAQKDRDYLDDEQIFLEALKCSPYHKDNHQSQEN